jgi:hypothetical protein
MKWNNMKHSTVLEKYPINELIIQKDTLNYTTVDQILYALKEKIDAHPVATYIATFDHYKHTKGLAEGEINESILDAKNIIFCFGKQLPNASMMALRPRSIGVLEYKDTFAVSFMDAPNPQAHEAMTTWVKSI